MKRGKVNLVIDVASIAIFVLVVSTGVVLKVILPPGSGRLPSEGGTHDQILVLWGWSRHQWGQIHTYFSVALLLVLSFHIVLHWRFFFRKNAEPGIRRRLSLGVVGVLSVLALALAPLVSPVRTISVSGDQARVVSAGSRTYELECARCHGSGGRGIPPFPEGGEGEEFLRKVRPETAHAVIRGMSPEKLGALADYLHSLATPSRNP